MPVCIHVHVRLAVHVHIRGCVHVHIRLRTHIHVLVLIVVCVRTRVRGSIVCVWVRVCVHFCPCSYYCA